jgi:hypothetical protein
MLRFTRNHSKHSKGCHCEEHGDEAISRHSALVIRGSAAVV